MKTEYIIHSIYKVERCGILIYDPHARKKYKAPSGREDTTAVKPAIGT